MPWQACDFDIESPKRSKGADWRQHLYQRTRRVWLDMGTLWDILYSSSRIVQFYSCPADVKSVTKMSHPTNVKSVTKKRIEYDASVIMFTDYHNCKLSYPLTSDLFPLQYVCVF